MRLSSHLAPVNLAGVATQLGRTVALIGALLVVPAAVSLLAGEPRFALVFAALAAACAGSGLLAARLRRDDIGLREGLVITALAYLVLAGVGMVPYLLVAGPVDALFESMSGFTTTGLSVIPVQRLGPGLLFFRAYSQWVGGGGIVVLSLAVLLRTSRAAHRLYASEFGGEQLVGSVTATARAIAGVYVALTAVAGAALVVAGLDPWRSVLYALAAVSTGGFSPDPGSVGALPSVPVRVVLVAVMVAGATSFPLFARARRRGLRVLLRDIQVRALLTLAAAAAALLLLVGHGGALGAVFNAVSAVTTTGFSTSDPASWSGAEQLIVMTLMVVGGSAGSTAGGLKLYRLVVLGRTVRWLLAKTLLPEEARVAVTYGGTAVGSDELRRMGAVAVLYAGILAVSAAAVAGAGVPVVQALFDTASALGTVGLSAGAAGADLAASAKLVLTADMWMGRLEILPVVILLYPPTWRL